MRALLATIRPDTLAGSDSFTAQWSCAQCSGRSAAALRVVQSMIAAAQAREKLSALRGYPVETLPPSCKRTLSRELRLARRNNLSRSKIFSFHITPDGESPSIHNQQPPRSSNISSSSKSATGYPILMLDGTNSLRVPTEPDDEDFQKTDVRDSSKAESDDDDNNNNDDEEVDHDEPSTEKNQLLRSSSPTVPMLRTSNTSAPYPVLMLDGTTCLSVPRLADYEDRVLAEDFLRSDGGSEDASVGDTHIVVDCDLIKTEMVENVGYEVECETDDATLACDDDAGVTRKVEDVTAASEADDSASVIRPRKRRKT